MTDLAVDWVTLSTPEFVAWTRAVDLTLPFPLGTSDLPYIDAPATDQIERVLLDRKLGSSPVLDTARTALGAPRLIVYAVRVLADGSETKYVAAAGHDGRAVLVLLDHLQAALRTVAETELAAGVVASLPSLPPLATPSVEVALEGLRSVDELAASDASPRTLRAEMGRVGLPEPLIRVQLETPPGPVPSGVIGAVGFGPDDTRGRHCARSAGWREFPQGTVLQVERGTRHGSTIVLLAPFSPDAVFRAAADAISSLYEGPTVSRG